MQCAKSMARHKEPQIAQTLEFLQNPPELVFKEHPPKRYPTKDMSILPVIIITIHSTPLKKLKQKRPD